MSMEYTFSEMWRRMNNMIKRGTVHSVQLSPPRCRVSFGTDPINNTEHLSGWLPWYTRADGQYQEWRVPAVGAPVTVISEGGDLRNGVVLAGLITDDQAPAGTSGETYVTRYGNGATVSCDTAANAMTITLPDGGALAITAPGGMTIKGDVEVEGSVKATGDVADKTGTLQAVRETYNGHTHPENGDGGGTTSKPNQSM